MTVPGFMLLAIAVALAIGTLITGSVWFLVAGFIVLVAAVIV